MISLKNGSIQCGEQLSISKKVFDTVEHLYIKKSLVAPSVPSKCIDVPHRLCEGQVGVVFGEEESRLVHIKRYTKKQCDPISSSFFKCVLQKYPEQ